MVIPDSLDAILERLKNNTVTSTDLDILVRIVGGIISQNVTQTGKYNINLGQASSTQIGDHYGPSVEEIRAIVRELQPLQTQNSSMESQQSEQIVDNEPLEIPPVESQMVELINPRLALIAELQTSGELSITQQIEFNKLRGKVNSVKDINQELQEIADSVNKMLQEAVEALAEKLRKLDRSQSDSLLNVSVSDHFCLKQQIELLEQFQIDLTRGKLVAHWLMSQQLLAQHLGGVALDAYPRIKEALSPRRLEAFYFSLEKFIERLTHCLTWGRTSSLDNPVTSLALDEIVYITAFESLKTMIPDYLPDDGIDHLKEYIDYLIKSLPSYRHNSID